MTQYLVIYERGEHSWGAYSPDLPGCIAAGRTREEVETLMSGAVEQHPRRHARAGPARADTGELPGLRRRLRVQAA